MRKTLLLLASTILFSCTGTQTEIPLLNIIPYPAQVGASGDEVLIGKSLNYHCSMPQELVSDIEKYLATYYIPTERSSIEEANLFLKIDSSLSLSHPEGYELSITEEKTRITASSYSGIFYGLQTLAQLCQTTSDNASFILPLVEIKDYPRFEWRGMHLDVSRHFYDVEFIKKQLDLLSSFKINTFHWHLTDGTGWRLEIPGYPLLTQVTAWRPLHSWKDWWFGEQGRVYCTEGGKLYRPQDARRASSPMPKQDIKPYGGYYTAEDVKEVLDYARLRNITVIPEIEMPGHSEEVLAVYPQLSCTGTPYKHSEFCIGNEETFKFLEDVLAYVIELFPSEFIHIGGDEANKTPWKSCPKCQKRIKKEGLENEDELQSYLIQRVEKFINSKGRRLIGWDEILEGGLAPNATVMSWRGIAGGVEAAERGNDAVMTPGEFCYLDFYQSDPETQPEAIGGYLTLEKAYSFDPIPSDINPQAIKHILGVQGNVWTEYMPTYQHTEYMIYPRIIAIAEVGWTLPENKSWESFKVRINQQLGNVQESGYRTLQERGYNPFTLSTRAVASQSVGDGSMQVALSSERYPVEIRYTLDSSEPTLRSSLYEKPIEVKDSADIKVKLFAYGEPIGESISVRSDYHKGIGKKATYNTRIYPDYAAGGENALIDGLMGGKGYGDGRWQGFCPEELDVVIDLGEEMEISMVKAKFMQVVGPNVLFPSKVEVYASSNGTDFKLLGEDKNTIPLDQDGVLFKDFGWKGTPTKARYVQFIARQTHKKYFIFTDEIIIQ